MSDKNEDRPFTATEVGTMLESLRHDLALVSENLGGRLDRVESRLGKVEGKLDKVEMRLIAVEDCIRIAVPSLVKRVASLEAKAL